MMMPAPTPEEIFTKTELSVAAADAAPVLGQGAEVGVVLDVHRGAEGLLGRGAGVDALPAGEDRRRADHVVGDRGGQAEPDVAQRAPCRPDIRASICAGACPAPRGGRWPASRATRSSASTRPARSPTATATWLWPKSTPATMPAPRASRTDDPRRPLPASVSTSPTPASSRTMLETVAGASPVTRASSAWVKPPSPSRSTVGDAAAVGRYAAEHVEHPVLVGRAQRGGRPRGGVGALGRRHGRNCASRTALVVKRWRQSRPDVTDLGRFCVQLLTTTL